MELYAVSFQENPLTSGMLSFPARGLICPEKGSKQREGEEWYERMNPKEKSKAGSPCFLDALFVLRVPVLTKAVLQTQGRCYRGELGLQYNSQEGTGAARSTKAFL